MGEERNGGRGDELSEADEVTAVEVSVPRQVAGSMLEVSDVHVVSVYHCAYTLHEWQSTE